jgi:hypothetical protein
LPDGDPDDVHADESYDVLIIPARNARDAFPADLGNPRPLAEPSGIDRYTKLQYADMDYDDVNFWQKESLTGHVGGLAQLLQRQGNTSAGVGLDAVKAKEIARQLKSELVKALQCEAGRYDRPFYTDGQSYFDEQFPVQRTTTILANRMLALGMTLYGLMKEVRHAVETPAGRTQEQNMPTQQPTISNLTINVHQQHGCATAIQLQSPTSEWETTRSLRPYWHG